MSYRDLISGVSSHKSVWHRVLTTADTPSKAFSKLKTLFEGSDNYQKASSTLAHLKEVYEFCKRLGVKCKIYINPLNSINEAFFSGGIMPSDDLLLHFQRDLSIVDRWRVDGTHYQKTCDAWLAKYDAHSADGQLDGVLLETYGKGNVAEWRCNCAPRPRALAAPPALAAHAARRAAGRLFFLGCAELFGYAGGSEWQVSHYLFEQQAAAAAASS